MEPLYSEAPKLKLIKKRIKLLVVDLTQIGLGIGKTKKYLLPDSSYGEWIIYDQNFPKYYFCAFDEKGELLRISEYAKENNIEIPLFLAGLLNTQGYTADPPPKESFSIQIENRSQVQEFELLQILDE